MARNVTQKEFKDLVKTGRLFKLGSIGCPNKEIYKKIKAHAEKKIAEKKFYDGRFAKWENIVHLRNTQITAYPVKRKNELKGDKKLNEITMIMVWFKDTKSVTIYYYLNYEFDPEGISLK